MDMQTFTEKIAGKIRTLEKKSLLIGISGHGASGKTTFAEQLIAVLGDQNVNYLNTDPYIILSDVRKYTNIEYMFDQKSHQYTMTACHPSAHFVSALERDIQMIKAGYDLQTIDVPYAPTASISSSNAITIVEGMSTAFINPDLFDLSIYFYTDGETEWIRRSTRDTKERDRTLKELNDSHQERRIQYKLFMHPFREHFDIVVKSSEPSSKLKIIESNFTI
ncbi:uridine kinase family protein [Marinilactibacillus piezotolerans]|uniref:uridine kinase family protein n=1 Tax=Marinilactibacillus piezotolerans TaxID=258723 RepID=UPI002118308D|nr:phosphoribulokinase [Marinilactibacillus piezotolerans]